MALDEDRSRRGSVREDGEVAVKKIKPPGSDVFQFGLIFSWVSC